MISLDSSDSRGEFQGVPVVVTSRPRKDRHLGRWLALALVLILVGVAAAVWSAMPAYNALRDAQTQLNAIEQNRGTLSSAHASKADLYALDAHDVSLLNDLHTIRNTWNRWKGLTLFTSNVAPNVHDQLSQVGPLLDYASLSAQAAHMLRQPLEPILTSETGGTRPFSSTTIVADLASSRPTLQAAGVLFERAVQARNRVAVGSLPAWVRQKLAKLDPLLSQAPQDLQELAALPAALGADGVRNYLVIPQNSRDLRATGGFIGTVGILQIDHGRAKLINLQDAYQVDHYRRPDVDQPLPMLTHGWVPWYFRDANWSADFPTSAQLLEQFYRLGTSRHVDGVIAFDDLLLPSLLTKLGPVQVPGYKETLTSANAFERIDYQVNVLSDTNKAFALAAYKATFAKLMTLSSSAARELLDVVRQNVQTRHILIYANDPTEQSAIRQAGADGAINRTSSDYLYIVDTNTSTNKVAHLVKRAISYKAAIQHDRSITAELTIRYRNEAVAGKALSLEQGGAWFSDFVRVFVPADSTLLSSKGLDGATWPTLTVHGKTQFSGYFRLNSLRTRTVSFRYRIPANVDTGAHYSLVIQKQPGTAAVPVRLTISAVGGVHLARGLPAKILVDANVSLTASLIGGVPHPVHIASVAAEVPLTPGSHPEPWVTVPDGWVNLPDWAAISTGSGWCVPGSHKLCHHRVIVQKAAKSAGNAASPGSAGLVTTPVSTARRIQLDASSYTDPAQLTGVPFGASSQWAQPWRAYLETVPATTFIDGTGVYLDLYGPNQDLPLRMLASHGIHNIRIMFALWSTLAYDNVSNINDAYASMIRQTLLAAKKYGMRPIIGLYAYQWYPCPARTDDITVTVTARAGATTLTLGSVSGLRVGYSGMDVPDSRPAGRDGPFAAAPYPPTLAYDPYNWMAGNMITAIHGKTITVAKPLAKTINARSTVRISTLKYRPFSVPGSADYKATMQGWLHYVQTISGFATKVLGTSGSADKGFDLEIWNELSESPHFLFINDYYGRTVYKYDEQSIYHNLVAATAAYVSTHTSAFAGVRLGDGVASNIPWPASSTEPARVTAIDKHPYERRITYPKPTSALMAFDDSINAVWNRQKLNALYQPDASPFIPSYTTFFPEYFGTFLRTDSLIRDMAPSTTSIDGVTHGRNARVVKGKVEPETVWVTEAALDPKQDLPSISKTSAQNILAKIVARYFCFYLGKGATQVDLFSSANPDVGLLPPNLLSLAAKRGATYPKIDAQYTTPALMVTMRIERAMQFAIDRTVTLTRPLQVLSVTDNNNHAVFNGDGTAAHPSLRDSDVFTFLPFEANPHRFVIPYYVMTRDVMVPLPPEKFTVRIAGVRGVNADISAYDPLKNATVPVGVVQRDAGGMTLVLTAADYPYLLTIQEH